MKTECEREVETLDNQLDAAFRKNAVIARATQRKVEELQVTVATHNDQCRKKKTTIRQLAPEDLPEETGDETKTSMGIAKLFERMGPEERLALEQ